MHTHSYSKYNATERCHYQGENAAFARAIAASVSFPSISGTSCTKNFPVAGSITSNVLADNAPVLCTRKSGRTSNVVKNRPRLVELLKTCFTRDLNDVAAMRALLDPIDMMPKCLAPIGLTKNSGLVTKPIWCKRCRAQRKIRQLQLALHLGSSESQQQELQCCILVDKTPATEAPTV